MSDPSYPIFISLYKGEGRLLLIPIIDHIGGFSVHSDSVVILRDLEDYPKIGRSVVNTVEFIKNSPLSESTPREREANAVWEKNSKYKSELAFWKNNLFARVKVAENGDYSICSMKRSETRKCRYSEMIKGINLLSNAADDEIGKAVIKVFKASEDYYRNNTEQTDYLTRNIELMDGSRLHFKAPDSNSFLDCEDCGAAEIYQCYSCVSKTDAEPIAEMFIGAASELDCNLQEDNIADTWQNIYGKAEFFERKEINHGIFKLCAEMRNKEVHKLSYFLQMSDDLLLECSMELHQPNRRKRTDEKLVTLLNAFALSCKLESVSG